MSHRTHFWLRLVGLTLILAAEFGPRAWTAVSAGGPPPSSQVAAVVGTR